ncbi:hypothetical protein [Priestia megaterium]|uniref:hypothetical protein n=1 Tax=Priestia megaterium TaxID=1404 RepID=UPI000BFC375B|nr:hypothetical protein [Priestia megaterium]PGQ88245.1 hypothetical protein COA18_04780 [Priestia megaterium]
MVKIGEFSGNVKVEHLTVCVDSESKEHRSFFVPMVKTKHKDVWQAIHSNGHPSGMLEAPTEDEAMQLGRDFLIRAEYKERSKDVKVFQLNEADAVAAYTLESAKEWYLQHTGLSAKDAFEDYEAEEISKDYKVYLTEENLELGKIKVQKIVEHFWKGTPFIVFSMDL